jgi:uncharacterized FlgJ-related protein
MKTGFLQIIAIVAMMSTTAFAQSTTESKTKKTESMNAKQMNTYVIERQISGAGKFDAQQLQNISKTSCSVLTELGPEIQWIQSYVTEDKIFCVYKAVNEDILRKHAEKGGFPINSINKLSTMISPTTATASLSEIMR